MSGQIKLNLPSGGSKTIAAPDSASTETITLPAGTKTLLANDSTNGFGVDTNGNAGLGVTPESWGSNRKGLQVGLAASLIGHSTAAYSALTNNAYYDTGWKYTNSDEAALVEMETNGTFAFKVAGSGTAGQPITTWTTGFEVLNDGKARAKNGLLFGTDTAAANALDDYEEGTFTVTLASGATTSPTNAGATYTKIGNIVTVRVRAYFGSITLNGTPIEISGLPFIPVYHMLTPASCYMRCAYNSAKVQFWFVDANTSTLKLQESTAGTFATTAVNSQASGTYTPEFDVITVTYRTN